MKDLVQGSEVQSIDEGFADILHAIVDYRGDVTIHNSDGTCVEGYVFGFDQDNVHLFPKNGGAQESLRRTAIRKIEITGEDMSAGRSWDDWVRRREAEKAKAAKKSQPE